MRNYKKRLSSSKRRITKRKYIRNKSNNKKRSNNNRRKRTRRNTKGGAYCSLHPAPITGAQATSNNMTQPSAFHGENNIENNTINDLYWSNFNQTGTDVLGGF